MKRALTRAALGAATVITVLGLTAPPAAAENPYTPAESDFADCPAKPAGARDWTCYVMTALDGIVRFNKMSARVDQPLRLTVAQGKTAAGATVAAYGGLRGDAIPFKTGVVGTPLELPHPTGWSLKIEGTGLVEPGIAVPHRIGLRARVIGADLGDSCRIGSTDRPVVVEPRASWAFPWFFGGVPMVKTQVYDDVYSLPPATGCANGLAVNTLIGLPANATSNHFQVQWALRHKTF